MKNIVSLSAFILLLGCSTLTSPEVIQFVADRAEQATRIAVVSDLTANPTHRVAYAAGVVALDALLQSENYDSEAFKAALAALPIKEFQGPQGALLVEGSVFVFDLVTMFAYNIESEPAVHLVMQGIRDGMSSALATSKTATRAFPQPAKALVPRKTVRI